MKKIIVALMMAILVLALVACNNTNNQSGNSDQPEGPVSIASDSSADGVDGADTANNEDISVSNISDEKVLMTEDLQQVTYNEGEEQVNPFYKKGVDEDGNACYVVRLAGQDTDTNIPMDNTVIYSMEEGTSHIEKVGFSYEMGDEVMNVEQYRLHINLAQE